MPMYIASSVFVRHTLNALYSDLKVVLNKVSVTTPPSPNNDSIDISGARRKSRDKSLFVGLTATGVARVSGGQGEWEV
jgi:hypothetical protein